MSRFKCSVCDERIAGRAASIYWAWMWPSGLRMAFKQRLDATCVTVYRDPIKYSIEHPDLCLHCQEPTNGNETVWVYGTAYAPGQDRLDVEFSYHPPCFEKEVERFKQGAERLADRPGVEGGGPQAPSPREAWPSWASMGIEST